MNIITPQNAVFIEGTSSTIFLEFKINQNTDIAKLKKSLIKVYETNSEQLYVLISFSKSGYQKLGAPAPEGLLDFETLKGIKNLSMPSSQSEMFIWAHSHSKSAIIDFQMKSKTILEGQLTVEIEQEGFR